MPNFSGMWTERQQMQAAGASTWPAFPGAPTIGTATAGVSSASVGFTAPSNTGYPAGITSYTATSSPGGFTGTGASSPITVSGLTIGTAYTFTVTATNATGTGPESAASNSVTPVAASYIEDVFSTYLYAATGANRNIQNNIALATGPTNGTVLQLNGDSIVDSAPIPNTLTNNNVTINTTTFKSGTGSLAFNGTSSYLSFPTSAYLNFYGDFTFQCWVYMTTVNTDQTLYSGVTTGDINIRIQSNTIRLGRFGAAWDTYTGGLTFSANTWYNIAIVRSQGVVSIYYDGTSQAVTGAANTNAYLVTTTANVGASNGSLYLTGLIDDLRVQQNVAQYTANFTPSSAVFPTDTVTTGKGGLVFFKTRTSTGAGAFIDTTRGAGHILRTNGTGADVYDADTQQTLTSFSSNGFTLGPDAGGYGINSAGLQNVASWTFAEQPKFFDVVAYTGTGSATTIAHNLGSTPGCIIVKRTDTTSEWSVYHRSLGAANFIVLNTTAASAAGGSKWNSTSPTDAVFSLGTSTTVNASGGTYVAYLFAHDAGGFGLTGTDNVISCGSFTTNASGYAAVNLGYEPQWIITKTSSDVQSWYMQDNLRGYPVRPYNNPYLLANTTGAENGASQVVTYPTSTGFVFDQNNPVFNSKTFIYIAIRRGPMRVTTDPTKVFLPYNTTIDAAAWYQSGFVSDFAIQRAKAGTDGNFAMSRLTGPAYLKTETTAAETSSANILWASNTAAVYSAAGYGLYQFQRAPSFFDEVCYTGTGANTTQTHNLGVVPELIIVKSRSSSSYGWPVYSAGIANTEFLMLDTTAAKASGASRWNSTTPTASVFSLGNAVTVNASGGTYVAYLFATCAGVSKVGSYTGTGATQTIACGFTGGARFVMIKRTDSTGDWYYWDTARGMVSGTDPSLLFNTAAAEVNANSVYTTTGGFQIVSTAAGINASGGTYIYLAIA